MAEIKVVKDNPCDDCGIKGLYDNCKDECVQYRKYYQYHQGKVDGRKEAILWVRKLIKIFWKDWNKSSNKKISYLAFAELDEHILEQADESNGREFMEYYRKLKEQNDGN